MSLCTVLLGSQSFSPLRGVPRLVQADGSRRHRPAAWQSCGSKSRIVEGGGCLLLCLLVVVLYWDPASPCGILSVSSHSRAPQTGTRIEEVLLHFTFDNLTSVYVCMPCMQHACMCACVHVCMCACVHVYVCMCVCVYVCMCVCMCMRVCMCKCMCMRMCMCICMCMCMCVCMFVCMYVCMSICVCIRIPPSPLAVK